MELGLFQQQTMKLVMTNELRQAISILQFSRQELAEFIQEQALENPLIELKEPSFEPSGGTYSSRSDPAYNPFDHIQAPEFDLKDDLLQQARYLNLDERTYKLVAYLIQLLDEDGYLITDIEEVSAELRRPAEDVERALAILQKLEPAGIGARSLQECLLLQIERSAPDNEIAKQIVVNHLDLLAGQQWQTLAESLSASADAVHNAAVLIKQLQPKPGANFTKETTEFIIPDLTIKKEQGKFVVIIHDQFLPKIQYNSQYKGFLSKSIQSDASDYVHQKYKQMNWLVKSIEQRQITLLRVTEAIIQRQVDFLEYGAHRLSPLTLKEISIQLDIHESTVSRAVKGKYAQTPLGLLELKSFFNSKIKTNRGEDVSSTSVKSLIKVMIDTENRKRPLSDERIASALKKENHISISRRTVAKYRSELSIPSSSKRKNTN